MSPMASTAIGVRAATTVMLPSRLEPSGLYHSDLKCPDGITMVPRKNTKLLVWDATCPDTFAPSYITSATSRAGAVAAQAEKKKRSKYSHLDPSHVFVSVAIETTMQDYLSSVNGPVIVNYYVLILYLIILSSLLPYFRE